MSEGTSSTMPRLNFLPDFPGRKLVYHPLNSLTGEIRVIVVLHDAEREAPLRCFLKTISIHEGKSTEPYNAISYYWGSTENPETVEVYGGSWGYHQFGGSFNIPITSNLALALRQFRAHATAERQRLVIWTDALCVNQTDPEERSAQVSIMRDIYKAAHVVWMWIGGTSLAAEAGLHNLYFFANLEKPSEILPNDRLEWMLAIQYDFVEGIPGNFGKLCVRNLAAFVSADYWRRGWIIQEATANDNTYLCYGPARYRIVSWHLLAEVLDVVRAMSSQRLQQPMGDFNLQRCQLRDCQDAWNTHGRVSAEQVKQLRIRRSECPSMVRWLLSICTSNCWHTSDPRDRVNALISAMPPYWTLGFQPDYSKSTEDVFISATIHLLRIARSWSHVQFLAPSGSPYLPSWTMDFTDARPLTPTHYCYQQPALSQTYFYHLTMHIVRMYDPGLNMRKSRFGADAKTPFRLRQMTQGILETAGLIVDEVVSVGSLFTVALDHKDDAKALLRSWYRILSQNKRYTRQNTTLNGRARKWEALCRTTCIGRVGEVKFDASHAPASEALWDMVIYERQRHPESMRREARELYEDMLLALVAARFIVTRRGRIGVAPRNTAAGDFIGILASGDVPFVLRSVKAEDVPEDAYILLGGCYIDGKTSGASSCTSTADSNRYHVRRSRRRGS
jgi:hypothetical protein